MTKRLSQVMVKPAGADCNLRCSYCFYLSRKGLYPETSRPRMSREVAAALVEQVLGAGEPGVAFSWQGGEPTLMGLDFFQWVVGHQSRTGRAGQVITNTLQTNGQLINQDWAAFLARNHFLVGLSLDGPRDLHDLHRRSARRGSWSRAAAAGELLLQAGAEVNALVLLNADSATRVREIWTSLKDLGLRHFQFIPCLEMGREHGTWASWSLRPEAYARVLLELFELWLGEFKGDFPGVYERWFEALLFSYTGGTPPLCTLQQTCGDALVVEHNGDVYSCDFYVEPAWRLGNLLETGLADLLASTTQEQFGKRKAAVPDECLKCPWLVHCRGGCPKDRDRELHGRGINPYCQSYKLFFEHADPELRRLAERWRELKR